MIKCVLQLELLNAIREELVRLAAENELHFFWGRFVTSIWL